MAVGRLRAVAIDCAEPEELAEFWAALTGGKVAFRSPQFCAVDAGGAWLTMVRVADHTPPTWPDGPTPKQMHLDVSVTDTSTRRRRPRGNWVRAGRTCSRRRTAGGSSSTRPATRSASPPRFRTDPRRRGIAGSGRMMGG